MLRFLGSGSAFDAFRCDTSAYFRRGDTLFMIDCGSTAFKCALRKRIFEGAERVCVILTHLHMDHCGSLSQLVMYLLYKCGVKPVIVFPDRDVRELLRITGVGPDMYVHISGRGAELPEGVKVRYLESAHVDTINCYSLELSLPGGDEIYYSGDSGAIPDAVLEKFLDGGYKAFYQDTTGERIQGTVHLHIEDLCRLIPEDQRGRVYCIHLDPLLTEERVRRRGFNSVEI
ncbi:MAG: MBL fold metallo-hydrolase [Ruminococcus sp.]|nr:MBL fold metallo-hydrolase [Ruminococcus sp.]